MNEERKAVLDKLFIVVDKAMDDIDKGEYDKANARYPYAKLLQECLTGDQSEKGFENQHAADDKSVQEKKSQEDTVIMAETVATTEKESEPVEVENVTDDKPQDPTPVAVEKDVEPEKPAEPAKKANKDEKYTPEINAAIADGIGYPITGWPRANMTDDEKADYYNSLYKAGEYDLRAELLGHISPEEIQRIFHVSAESLTTGYFEISGGFEQDNGTQTENTVEHGVPDKSQLGENSETTAEPVETTPETETGVTETTETGVVAPVVTEPVGDPVVEASVNSESDSESDEVHTDSGTNQGDQKESEEKDEGNRTDTETNDEIVPANDKGVSANDEVEKQKEEKKDDVRDMIEQMVNEEFGDPTVEQVCYAMNNPQTEIFMKYYAVISLILSEIIPQQKKFLGVSNFDPLVRKLIEYVSQVYAVHAGVKGYTQELIDERISQDYYGLRELYDIDVYSEFSKQLGEGDMKELLEKRIESMGDKYKETAEDIIAVYGTLYEEAKLFDVKKADKAGIHIVKKHRNQVYQVAGWEATAKELQYGEMPFKFKDPKAPKTTKWTPELKKQMAEQRNIQYAAKELMKSYCTAEESKSMCHVITGGVHANLSDTIVNPSTITYVNRVLNELLKNIYQYYGFESLEDVVKTLGIVEKEEETVI